MVIIHRTAFADNITIRRDVGVIFGTRGGILLSMELNWAPRSYHNANTENQTPVISDIHVLLKDSTTGRSPIGQSDLTHPGVDSIVVPTNGSWNWRHPEEDLLLNADVMGRLTFNSSFAEDPIGLIRGGLVLTVEPDPNNTAAHSLVIEAKFLAFDSAVV